MAPITPRTVLLKEMKVDVAEISPTVVPVSKLAILCDVQCPSQILAHMKPLSVRFNPPQTRCGPGGSMNMH